MKKIFIIAILLVATFLIGQQVFRYIKYKGNLIISISNQSRLDSVNIELYLDGEKLITDFFTNDTFHNYKVFPIKTSVGRHHIIIKEKKMGFTKEFNLTFIFMKWVVVDFFENDDISVDKSKYTFLITTQSNPFVIE